MCKKSIKKQNAHDKDLHQYLRHNKRYLKRSKPKQNRGKIPNRTPTEQRPKIVEQRNRLGDLEVGLMMGTKYRPGLIVLTDRQIHNIAAKIIRKMKSKSKTIKTMTFDNDPTFAKHEKIAKQLGVETYFTRTYTSQDKGTVENRIGVIRRFFPKGT